MKPSIRGANKQDKAKQFAKHQVIGGKKKKKDTQEIVPYSKMKAYLDKRD